MHAVVFVCWCLIVCVCGFVRVCFFVCVCVGLCVRVMCVCLLYVCVLVCVLLCVGVCSSDSAVPLAVAMRVLCVCVFVSVVASGVACARLRVLWCVLTFVVCGCLCASVHICFYQRAVVFVRVCACVDGCVVVVFV